MGLFDKLRGSRLPKAESISRYSDLSNLVTAITTHHASDLRTALGAHPQLNQAWHVIQESAHPDNPEAHEPLCDARRSMVEDLISVLNGGQLTEMQVF